MTTTNQNDKDATLELQALNWELAKAAEGAKRGMHEAITCMRRFLDEAERAITVYEADPVKAAHQVLHHITWGQANAVSAIETAMSHGILYTIASTRIASISAQGVK